MTTDESVLLVLLAFVVVDRLFCEFFFCVCLYNILTAIGFFHYNLQFCLCVFSFAFQCVCFADERYTNIYDFCSFLFHSNAV